MGPMHEVPATFARRSATVIVLAALMAGIAAFVLAVVGAGPTLFYVLGAVTVAIAVLRLLVPSVGLGSHGGRDLPEFIEDLAEGGGRGKTRGALQGAKESIKDVFAADDEDEEPERDFEGRVEDSEPPGP